MIAKKKIKIVKAAIEIVASEGLARLPFDRLVKATDISKGGILYHFKSKDTLLTALVEHIEQVFIENYKSLLGNETPHPGRSAYAYLRAALEGYFDQQLYVVLVAITTEKPALPTKQESLYQTLRRDIKVDGGNFAGQWMLVAALDSLWIDYNSHIFGLEESEHAELGQLLLSEARAIVESKK